MIRTILFGLLVIFISSGFVISIFFLLMYLSRKKLLKFRPALFSGHDWNLRNSQNFDECSTTKMRAFVRCNAERQMQTPEYVYTGFKDCSIQKESYTGESGCSWGCIGYGSCVSVCPQQAISIKNGTAVVDSSCIGCGKCTNVCPNGLIIMIPADADYAIACAAEGNEKLSLICSKACTGCAECEHTGFPEGFYLKNNTPYIDYTKKGDRSYAAGHCKPVCVVKYQPEDKKSFKLWELCSTLVTGGKDGE